MIISKETFKIAKDSVDYAIQLEGEIKQLKKELQDTKAQLEKAVDVIQDMYDAEGFDTVLVEQFLSRIKNKQGSEK